MPKFKKKDQADPSLNYTRRGFRLKGRLLHLAGGIVVRPVWSRELPAELSSVRIYRDSLGHWYASFVVRTKAEPLPGVSRMIGIDWGVTETATTTSEDHDLPHPEHGRKASGKLARYQRMMARRRPAKGKPSSNGCRKAKAKLAKAHRKVARQRLDTGRKWAKSVVRDFDQITIEDLKPKFLAKSTMARKAADAAIGAIRDVLVQVAPAYTTMDCGWCGARTKHALPLSERTYTCTACGVVCPRDKNSARVMLVRAGFLPAGADRVRPVHPQGDQAA